MSTLLEVMSMKLIAGMGTRISLIAEVFQSGVLVLSEGHRAAIRNQINVFLDAL